MEILGRGYVIEHCISALNFDREREKERKSFEIYVTDALMVIAENTTNHVGLNGLDQVGKKLAYRWYEQYEPQEETEPIEEDTRPCEEIALDIFARIRGEK